MGDGIDEKVGHDTPTVRPGVTPSGSLQIDTADDSLVKVCKSCMEPAEGQHDYCVRCGSELVSIKKTPDPYISEEVGRYRIEEKIGQGGMGVVYRAVNDELGQSVAVKFLSKKFADDPGIVLRFLNEAKSYCRVNHPNAVTLLDYGQHDDGALYIITEFIEGQNVTQTLQESGPLPADQVLHVAVQIAEVLSTAHHQGVIHRDLKPDNIMLMPSTRGRFAVKVLDFGIAKIVDDDDGPTTETGSVFGTPEFMSPEQARGDLADPRSDIYALGIILFYMLTGKLPFRGKNKLVVLNMQLNEPAPRPSELREDLEIPARLEAVVMKCLNKKRSARYASADDLLEALEELRLPSGQATSKVGVTEAAPPQTRIDTVRFGESGAEDSGADEADPHAPTLVAAMRDKPSPDADLESLDLAREGMTTATRLGRGEERSHMAGVVAIVGVLALAILAYSVFGGEDSGGSDTSQVLLAVQVQSAMSMAGGMISEGNLDGARSTLAWTEGLLEDAQLSEADRGKWAELQKKVDGLLSAEGMFAGAVAANECREAARTLDRIRRESSGLARRLDADLRECRTRPAPATARPAPAEEPPSEPAAQATKPAPTPAAAVAPAPSAEEPKSELAPEPPAAIVEPDPPVVDGGAGVEEEAKKEEGDPKVPDGMALPPKTID